MQGFSFSKFWRKRGLLLILIGGLVGLVGLGAVLLLNTPPPGPPLTLAPYPGSTPTPTLALPVPTSLQPTPALPAPTDSVISPTSTSTPRPTPILAATPTPEPPTPTPTVQPRAVGLNPQHGIHAPIGFQWTDTQRQALSGFKDASGRSGAPGLVLALSSDVKASNNSKSVRMEEDLHQYARQGSQVFIRMYPQRFPGGLSEDADKLSYLNTISGTPEDVAGDIFRFVDEQQRRNGWHFTQIIPGNEPNIEWPDELYYQNLLPWSSPGDPKKYQVMNRFFAEVYRAWQRRVAQPDAAAYHDVALYFPPLAQDARANSSFYAGFYYYDGQRPIGNLYDTLREAVELYGRFSWHNYFQPGRACQDVSANSFPDWLKRGLEKGWPAVIGEAGWAPDKLPLASQSDSRARLVQFGQLLGLKWEARLYLDERPQWRTQDDTIDGARFEDDLRQFAGSCHLGNLKLKQPVGIAVWLAGSEGNFIAALGVEPGTNGLIRRWLRDWAALRL